MRKIETEAVLPAIDPGPAPRLQWLQIADLVIDDSYQRELKGSNWKTIRKIAENFAWSRFSPVFAAPIEGGKYALVDGQHRAHAAAMAGMTEVPALVADMDAREQAAAFAAVNGMVTKVNRLQIFKAALAAGEAWAVEADRIAKAGGCQLMMQPALGGKQPGQIHGVKSFLEIVDRYPAEAVIAALKALMAIEGWGDEPECWEMGVLKPALEALCQRPKAVARADFVRRFALFDLWGENDRIKADVLSRLRRGLPYMTRPEQMESTMIDWIDREFPDVMRVRG